MFFTGALILFVKWNNEIITSALAESEQESIKEKWNPDEKSDFAYGTAFVVEQKRTEEGAGSIAIGAKGKYGRRYAERNRSKKYFIQK